MWFRVSSSHSAFLRYKYNLWRIIDKNADSKSMAAIFNIMILPTIKFNGRHCVGLGGEFLSLKGFRSKFNLKIT